ALSFEDRRLRAPASDSSDGPGLLRHLTHHSDSPSEAFTALEDGNVFPHRSHAAPHHRVARPAPLTTRTFPYRVTLADMLTEDNIAIVSEMDLLTEYSGEERQKKAAALDAENNP